MKTNNIKITDIAVGFQKHRPVQALNASKTADVSVELKKIKMQLKAVMERMEDLEDTLLTMRAVEEIEHGNGKTYTHEEIKKMYGIE
ncbi:MAG: hypothetical protein LBQ37_03130 [Elusimicrobiota bacterium]|jgi:predicted DNA-binding protein|nr:hypothetical protein [Elusimicrobiota bacterium]